MLLGFNWHDFVVLPLCVAVVVGCMRGRKQYMRNENISAIIWFSISLFGLWALLVSAVHR